MLQVPVGYVVTRVAQDPHILEKAWYQVHPPLIDEKSAGQINNAVVIEAILPPPEEFEGILANADSDEPEVIGAGSQDVEFAGLFSVVQYSGQMRSEQDIGGVQMSVKGLQRFIQLYVRIQVDDL